MLMMKSLEMEDGSVGDGSSESEAMGGVECALCSQPPIDPLSVLVCGHHFCKECFQREPSSSTRCPECGVEIDDDDVRIMDEAMQQIIFHLYPQTFFVTLEKRRKFLRDESQENIYPSWLLDNLETTYDPEEKVIVEVKWVSWPDWEQLTNVGKKRKIEEHSIDNERPSSSNSPCHVQLSESTISILPTTFRRYFRLPAKSTVSSLAKILEQKLEAPTKNSFVHFFSPCFQKIVEPNTKFGDIMLQQKGGRFRRVKLAFVCVQDSLKDELEPELGVEAMPILEVESSGEEAVPPVPALDHRPLTPTDPLPITFPSKRQFANADGFPKKLLQAVMPRKRRKPSSPTKRIPETGTPPPIIQTNPSSSTNLGSTTSLEALSEMPSPLGPPKILNSSMGTQVAGPSILHPPITGPISRPPKPKNLLGHGDGMPTGIHGLRPGVLPMGAPMLNGQKMATAGEHRLPTTQKVSITSTPLATAQQQMQNYNLQTMQHMMANMYNSNLINSNFNQMLYHQMMQHQQQLQPQQQQAAAQQRNRLNRQSTAFPMPVPGLPQITEQMYTQFRVAEQQAVAARTASQDAPSALASPSSNPLFPVRQIQLVNGHTNGGSP